MQRKSFVKKTISSFNKNRLERIIKILNDDKYIPFDFVEADKITRRIFAEKISDYFEKVELVAGGKSFSYIIENYAYDLDSVVKEHIDRGSHLSINGRQKETRAKRYYEKASDLRKAGLKSFEDLLDYSRIMLCLYMAIINKKHGYISDLDYSSECLMGEEIMKSLRNERTSTIMGSKRRFDTQGVYSRDRCTFVMIILMYQYIKNKEVEAQN